MRKVIGILLLGVLLLGGLAVWGANAAPAPKAANDPASLSPAELLVRDALAAELAGDNARRNELLAQALKEDPRCRPARWQSGFVNLDGKWVTPAEAAQKFAIDHVLAEYRRRRDVAARAGLLAHGAVDVVNGETNAGPHESYASSIETRRSEALPATGIAAHIELARWCRTKRLMDEERAHWTQVLLEDQKNAEAESRLGMRWFKGSLMTNAEIDANKKQRAVEEKQLADWKPTVTRWRKALSNGSSSERIQVADEMKQVMDPAVIPALEWATASDAPRPPSSRDSVTAFQRHAVALLGRLPQQRATYSLTVHAVLPQQSELRRAAADELKKRPLHDFVPILLDGLANPVQFEYTTSFDRNLGLATYQSVLSQEGRTAVHEIESSNLVSGLLPTIRGFHNTSVQHSTTIDVAHIRPTVNSTSRTDIGSLTYNPGRRGWNDLGETRAVSEGQRRAISVNRENERIENTNSRIVFVMEQVTGKSDRDSDDKAQEADAIPDSAVARPLISSADYWWNWWADYNETYSPPKRTVAVSYSSSSDVNKNLYAVGYSESSVVNKYDSTIKPRFGHSCFAAGTPVTSQIGPVSIEQLQIGDRVLAQDVDTGELSYKPVLGTTVRPPVEMVLISTTGGKVRTTRGHPFWIVGKGWRMAKELQVGDHVHCLDGCATVTATHAEPAERAYNLIVADFGTYFVGDGRILVHDNTPRLPTPAALPGIVKAER